METGKFGGLSDQYVTLKDAVVFPHEADNSCGVLDANGSFCDFSRGVMGPRRAAAEPVMPEGSDDLPYIKGRYVYGGWMRAHFGHFLVESTSRLWVLQEQGADFDGVIFTKFRRGGLNTARRNFGEFLGLLTDGTPLKLVRKVARVQELVVPDPGFGHHDRILGSERYRDFVRAQVAKNIQPNGPEKLYVSRSALIDKRGGIFGEERLEAMLKDNGYTVFHPEKHSIKTQLEHYRAARDLVSIDGSALHLAAFGLRPDARVGVVLRRHSGLIDGLLRQIALFSGAEVTDFDTLQASWIDVDANKLDFRSIGELDMVTLSRQLKEAGFVQTSLIDKNYSEDEIREIVSQMKRGDMRRVV